MFETIKLFSGPFGDDIDEDIRDDDAWIIEGEADFSGIARQADRSGDALRAIEWSELAARLNAARELRRELRDEAILCAGASGATFGDAAANLFTTPGYGERPVNPEALEGCKSSCGKRSERSGQQQKVTRETTYD